MDTLLRLSRSTAPYTLLLAGLLLLAGCDFGVSNDDVNENVRTTDIAVANAGAFGGQNSSFTFIDPNEESATTGSTFASYIQSHTLLDDRFLAVFGETGTIGIFDLETKEQTGQVTDIPNPRYVISDNQLAYVTSQDFTGEETPAVYVVDLNERTIIDTIELEANPEGLTGTSSSLYVATGEVDGQIVEINRSDNSIADTIDPECDTPRRTFMTDQQLLVVACSGATIFDDNFEVEERTDGALRIIDPVNDTIVDRKDLSGQLTSASEQQRAFYTRAGNTLFAVLEENTIVQYNTRNGDLSDFTVDGPPVGAIAFDVVNERLYLGRPDPDNPFGAAGTVTVHGPGGDQVLSYEAGIAPGHIALRITQNQ